MNFKDEVLTHYMDDEFLVTRDRDPSHWSTGNGLLFTGIFYTLLHLRGEIDDADVARFSYAVDRCYVNDSRTGHRWTGLLNRNENRSDKQAHDDYHILTASYFLKTRHAKEVCDYGSSHLWSFDNTNPGSISYDTWHGRFPGLIGYYRMCNRKSPGPLQALLLAGNFGAAACSDNETNGILTWLRSLVATAENQENCKDGLKLWREGFEKNHGSLSQLFAKYFGPHPFVWASEGIKP